MIQRSTNEQTLALAGIFQATGLVRDLAHEGKVRQDAFAVCVHSLFATNPANTEAVYGGVAGVRYGLELLIKQIGDPRSPQNLEVVKYVVNVLHLERQLIKRPAMLQQISAGVEKARGQSVHFDITHENIIASLAACYVDTISTLTPRIIVAGAQGHLSNPDNANKVRTLLLAAIRSTVLWRQCGGSRWQLFFGRRHILSAAQQLLAEVGPG